MRITEAARRVGVAADTVRFYERSGVLPSPGRRENGYRDYDDLDVEHLRLLVDLRRLDLPLDEAAKVAAWCHAGHCGDATRELPALIAGRRVEVAGRIERLRELDRRLAGLERHLAATGPVAGEPARPTARAGLPMIGQGVACCDAAGAVLGVDGCACCGPVDAG